MVSTDDVKALIAEGEGQRIEFKRSEILSNTTQLAIELTAFANADGGVILVGVKDDGTYERMMSRRGHQELIMNVASDRCEPPVRPLFEQKVVDGALVYVIRVQKSSVPHGVKFHGGTAFFVRVGSTTRSLHPSEVAAKSQSRELPIATHSPDFESRFSRVLDSLVDSLQSNGSYKETHRFMNEVAMMLKERIDAWDESSTEHGTRELFTRLYALSESKAPELYDMFRDLFGRAYQERKQMLEAMIWTIKRVMMESWAPEHNVAKAERACKLLLRLGVDFFHKDLSVTELCASAIDDLASDMFEPEVFSKEILLAAYAYREAQEDSNEDERAFADQLTDWIRENDKRAWDALYKSYFIDSMGFAFAEKETYGIDLRDITVRLYSSINKNINQQIQEFVDFLEDEVQNESHEYSFAVEDLVQIIMAYESVRPEIAKDIEKRILSSNTETQAIFNKLIESSKILTKIYEETGMITTFDEMMAFLETNSDFENVGIGVTAFGVTIIYFSRPLTKSNLQQVEDLAGTYNIGNDLELDSDHLLFEADRLVYKDGQHDMRKLVDFLRDLNSIAKVRSIATGMSFDLRRSPE